MAKKPPLERESDASKESGAADREIFLDLRTSFYQELARLLRMRTDMSLSDLIDVLENTGKYPRAILQDISKKLREGEASFSAVIREYAPVRDSVILNLSDKRACPLESALAFLVDFPE
ncbi:MAG: hypothetical protein M1313_11020 [Nitrospirae bacterium]|nr:hypothetical protein [Nitrospirota bacterium]